MPNKSKRKKAPPGQPASRGWLTTDVDEIERRRLRGASESLRVEPLTRSHDFFTDYRIHSSDGKTYRVEIRSLLDPINSCNCPDQRINGLGTCKHIEAVTNRLEYRRKRLFREAAIKGSPNIEIFLDRRDHQLRISWPKGSRDRSKARDLLAPFFSSANALAGEPLDRLPALQRAIGSASATVRRKIRISRELNPWLETLDRREQLRRDRQHLETEVARGNMTLDLLKYQLYPYQQEGMLHLAFTGRALLADEMGLGKTVQAVAACELLRRTRDIRRVLVISPASLKGEWEEQIAKFTDLSSHIIQGPRAKRLQQYSGRGFFFLANYEQVRPDVEEINTTLAPDVIILDEAQRIKNWQTKTATSVKRLKSPYAFVLTGTPVENRIDEIYSIAEFLDPHIFGPLFRFNRDFYQLDEKGRAIGYKNLDRLHERLQHILLRRRKHDVEGELPGRTVNTYFVPMHKEQALRYEEYESKVARLARMAQNRPLRKEEMERLQRYLACMRMLCDTPYILDQSCRISPKLKELGNILPEMMEDGDHKIIIFSEWERMLQLVREQADELGLGYAWHTGSVPQTQRRGEIRRFKTDPDCRLFLSTDSGSVGLNLQVADVVINLDIPWNPARLEQRIARAWRKHQKRPVQVVNLVSEGTIEHRMLSLLEQKRALAEGVVDGQGEKEMALPSGRGAFLERLDALLPAGEKAASVPPGDPYDELRDKILSRWIHQLELMELHGKGDGQTLLVVANPINEALQSALNSELKALFPTQTPRLQLLDPAAFTAIQQLIEAGVLSAGQDCGRRLYRSTDKEEGNEGLHRLAEAREHMARSERKRHMAQVLIDGGFSAEAVSPLCDAVETALQALLVWQIHNGETQPEPELIDAVLVESGLVPVETVSLLTQLRGNQSEWDKSQVTALLAQSDRLLSHAASLLGSPKEI